MNALRRIALLALLGLCGAALAADAPAPAPKPAPNTHKITVDGKTTTYANLPGAPIASDVGAAYEYRTRILGSPPSCQTFATDADAVFLSGTLDDKTKATQLKKIGAAAAAAGCLGP